jgi:STE24 endopeptidase
MIPWNNILVAYLIFFILSAGFRLYLERLNASNMKQSKGVVPEVFRGFINRKELAQMDRYNLDKIGFSVVESATTRVVFLGIILSGLLPWLTRAVEGIGFVWAGLVFFAAPALMGQIVDLPFDYYRNFVIEAKYGFNTSTRKLWLMDILKSLLLGIILGGVLLGLFLLMVTRAEKTWWIWSWAILIGFQLLMLVIYPTLIAPLFNKFTPIENEELLRRIHELAKEQGVSVGDIVQMDAGKRSKHTNAYFTGLGKVKRIVLYDTLLNAHDEDEILAVLAHEMGHLKKRHVVKQILIFGISSLALLFAASRLIHWEPMYRAFGFSIKPAYVGLFLTGILWEPAGFFLTPLVMAFSRKFERQADHYAITIAGKADPLIRALKKMAKDNLSNLKPHPAYVRFHYSHPPLLERIRNLEELERKVL